jgi:hypothetical protein
MVDLSFARHLYSANMNINFQYLIPQDFNNNSRVWVSKQQSFYYREGAWITPVKDSWLRNRIPENVEIEL